MEVDAGGGRKRRGGAQLVAGPLQLLRTPAGDPLVLGLLEFAKFGCGHVYLQSCHPHIRPSTPDWMSPERGIRAINRRLIASRGLVRSRGFPGLRDHTETTPARRS